MAKKLTVHRNAATGQFVKKTYADKHPKTTVKETVKKQLVEKLIILWKTFESPFEEKGFYLFKSLLLSAIEDHQALSLERSILRYQLIPLIFF